MCIGEGLTGPARTALVREWMAAPLRGAMEANSNGLRLIGSCAPRPLGGGYVAWPTQMGTALENRVMKWAPCLNDAGSSEIRFCYITRSLDH